MGENSFPKSHRLRGRNAIKELFKEGSSFYLHPFKVIARSVPACNTVQTLFSVSKRNFKKASDRNVLKRRMREAFRLNKSQLSIKSGLQIAYIYIGNEILEFEEIQKKMIESLNRLNEHAKAI